MKKAVYIIPSVLCIISLIVLFRPAENITFDRTVSENRIVFKYEGIGCGSLARMIVDGGEEVTEKYKNDYPDIGTNEIAFTKDSDEPEKHMDSFEFMNGGLAGKYTYIIEGEAVGVTSGAPDCCSPEPVYNENVVEFKIDKWYFTEYVPFINVGDFGVILITFAVLFISIIWFAVLGIIALCKFLIKKRNEQ